MLNRLVDTYGVEKLNTMTKYPSILTYHELGDKGSLVNSLTENKSFSESEEVYVTEKIDGTNSRIVFLGGDYFIGGRETFLYAKGDRFGDMAQSIVDTAKPVADKMCKYTSNRNNLVVVYGETYGGNVGQGSKQYTNDRSATGFRIFDIIEMDLLQAMEILATGIESIASWRDHGGQPFIPVSTLKFYGDLIHTDVVPYEDVISGSAIPVGLMGTYEWLLKYEISNAGLCGHRGRAEGVVVRTKDRTMIRKIRFEDYERTKRRGGF